MFASRYICSACRAQTAAGLVRQPRYHNLHVSSPLYFPRRKDFFSSNALLNQKQTATDEELKKEAQNQKQRRKASRSPAANTSLRRVAVEAQRSKDGMLSRSILSEKGLNQCKVPTHRQCRDGGY
jgi:hypothetical protein